MAKGKRQTHTAIRCLLPALLLMFLLPGSASAGWVLWDWSANINSVTYNPPALPGSVDSSGFDFNTGLGKMTFSFTGPGSNFAGLYLYSFYDHGDLDSNGDPVLIDHSSAYGTVSLGAPGAGISWEMDWPGDTSNRPAPTVFDHFAANQLDNTNHVPTSGVPPNACCSVAVALLESFILNANETATLDLMVGTAAPTSGFYLQVTDTDAASSIYLTEKLTINQSGQEPIPEPSTMWLLGTASAGLIWKLRRRRA